MVKQQKTQHDQELNAKQQELDTATSTIEQLQKENQELQEIAKGVQHNSEEQQTHQSIISDLQLKLVSQVDENERKQIEIDRLTEENSELNRRLEDEKQNLDGKIINTADEL